MAKKLSTQEILAAARAEKAKQAAASSESASPESAAPENDAAPEAAASSSAPSTPQPAPTMKSGGAPKSTQEILAAARAQKAGGAGGGEKPESEPPAKPAAKPGGPPKSTQDILAAVRAQKAGGQAAAPAPAKPVPAKPPKAGAVGKAVAKSGSAAATGERPSVQEMLKAVREGKKESAEEPVSAPPALRKPKKPVAPSKPIPKATPREPAGRRNFLLSLVATPFAAAWTMFSVASLAGLLGCARFMMPNIVNEPPSRFKVGNPGDYAPGTVSTKYTSQYGVWVVNAEYQGQQLLYALISICTHLGCTPNWLEGEQKFKCPCHGSGFYITGVNFEGPAPRPLERAGIRIAPDGLLEVDKSVKFQQELGQWDDAASKVDVA